MKLRILYPRHVGDIYVDQSERPSQIPLGIVLPLLDMECSQYGTNVKGGRSIALPNENVPLLFYFYPFHNRIVNRDQLWVLSKQNLNTFFKWAFREQYDSKMIKLGMQWVSVVFENTFYFKCIDLIGQSYTPFS
jgi:hypothetical protein